MLLHMYVFLSGSDDRPRNWASIIYMITYYPATAGMTMKLSQKGFTKKKK